MKRESEGLGGVWYTLKETAQNAPDPEKEVRDRFDLTGKSPYTRLEQV